MRRIVVDWRVSGLAIVSVAGLMGWALYLGHNGALLASAMAVIGGLAGMRVRLYRGDR